MPLHLAARSLLAKADFFVGEKWQVHSICWGLQSMSLSINMQSNIQSYPTNRYHSKSYTVWFLGIHRVSIESPDITASGFSESFYLKQSGFWSQLKVFSRRGDWIFGGRGIEIGHFSEIFRQTHLEDHLIRRGSEWIIGTFPKLDKCQLKRGPLQRKGWSSKLHFLKGFFAVSFRAGYILEVLLGHAFCSPLLKVDIDMLQASSVRWMHPSMPPPWTGGNAITHQGV